MWKLVEIVLVPFKLTQALHNPCCKLVVVELPSPVTAIDPAVDVPVSVFVLRVAIMPSLHILHPY